MVTIKEIAEIAGVHRSTVDKVLHSRPGVSAATRERVQRIIDELNYRPNPLGQALKRKQENIALAVVLRQVDACEVIRSGVERAREDFAGYDLDVTYEILPYADTAGQADAIHRAVEQDVDGILLMPSDTPELREAIACADEHNIPVITVNTDVPGSKRTCYVGENGYQNGRTAGCLMGEMLHEKGEVVLITERLNAAGDDSISNLRDEGFRAVLREDYPDIHIAQTIESLEDPFRIFQQLMQMLTQETPVDGIYITCGGVSEVGRALRMAGREHGIKVICYERYPDIVELLDKRLITCTLDSELEE